MWRLVCVYVCVGVGFAVREEMKEGSGDKRAERGLRNATKRMAQKCDTRAERGLGRSHLAALK